MLSYTQPAFLAASTHASMLFSMTLRNMIFARLLSPNDFAIALTFGVVLSLFEYISNFGYENLMQRSTNGDDETFQSTMQSVMVCRGIIIAFILFFFAPYIPSLLNIQGVPFNYQLLAVVPIIQGFAHLDPQRLHRDHDFTTSTRIGLIADALSVIIALLCAITFTSYWAFYFSFVFRHSVYTFLSHIWAIRPYRLTLNNAYLLELWYFGLPLILVGFLKYFGTEIDKALIARYSGLEQFTVYFLTLMIVINLTNVVAIGFSKIFIRRISLASNKQLAQTAHGNGIISLYLVFPLFCVFTFFGEFFITLIFGPQYNLIPYLLPIVVILASLRLLSRWLIQIVIGVSDNKLMLIADVFRILLLAVCVCWLINTISNIDVRYFALVFSACELFYLLILTALLSNKVPNIKVIGLKLLSISLCLNTLLFGLYLSLYNQSTTLKLTLCIITLIVIIGGFNFLSRPCRRQSYNVLHDLGFITAKATTKN